MPGVHGVETPPGFLLQATISSSNIQSRPLAPSRPLPLSKGLTVTYECRPLPHQHGGFPLGVAGPGIESRPSIKYLQPDIVGFHGRWDAMVAWADATDFQVVRKLIYGKHHHSPHMRKTKAERFPLILYGTASSTLQRLEISTPSPTRAEMSTCYKQMAPRSNLKIRE